MPSTTAGESARKQEKAVLKEDDGIEDITGSSEITASLHVKGESESQQLPDGEEGKHEGGRHRPRKRRLYAEICKQMEFYFSDANITKNRMMHDIILEANEKSEGFVDLNVFLDFTKIQRLTSSLTHIQKALVTSGKLELSQDAKKARRAVPFDANKVKSESAVEECTIYVENIPRDAEHEWLEKIFQAFGAVAYISLPKFRSGQHKGFAFVEFDDVMFARRCVEAYGEEGACLPNDIDPSELLSIKTFKEDKVENSSPKNAGAEKRSQSQKRKAGEADEGEPKPKREKKGEDSSSGVSEEEESQDAIESGIAEVGATSVSKSKRSRKRKKNKAKKSGDGDAKLESESIMLKVLPKKTWKQLRNRYLNLQRSNMSKVKKQLQKEHLRAQHFKNFYQPPTYPQHHFQSQEIEEMDQDRKTVDHILEVKLAKPPESSEAFRRLITVELAEQDEDEAAISGFIKFVDYKDDECHAFVRVNGDDSFSSRADHLLKKAQETFSSAKYMTVKEAAEYKHNVQAALKKKQKEQPRKNVRGKDRLMKAATKSTHIYFDSSGDENDKEEVPLKEEN